MEAEQHEEHTTAMQNCLTTTTSLSALEKMPAEIILMIGSEFGSVTFMRATLVSKRLRSVLLPRGFKRLTFSGSLKKLAHDMRSFLSGEFKNLMMTIRSTMKYNFPYSGSQNHQLMLHLRSVTIRFEPYSSDEESTDSHLSTHRIAVISEFISKLSSIDLISFDNQIENEIDFTEALANQPKWNGPKAVIFCGRQNFPIFSALINQFAPNTVKAAELPRFTARKHPLALKAAFPLLKGLKADVSAFKSRSQTHACMSSSNLQVMDRYFPHLEALVLDQLDVYTFKASGKRVFVKPHLPNLNEYVEKLITQLKSMSQLRRFAFTLHQSWLHEEYDCELLYKRSSSSSGDESDDATQATPEPNEWPYWLSTDAQWSGIVTSILEAVPQLKELCIVHSGSAYHRGTKTENIVTVRKEEMGYREKPSQFPYVLADID
ncbi:hypothetical protein H9Q70_012827 [Fusarium xylarioides]|nr:hypothetical protein H9Q70_012827 [Fusarium xylarioides]KAG5807680.1 hypothetical protein H9Q71_007750 [Fusarium xylarioides]KAG5822325.1 hypothetical protein H9Q74_007596 [Fusarium xylarioides]